MPPSTVNRVSRKRTFALALSTGMVLAGCGSDEPANQPGPAREDARACDVVAAPEAANGPATAQELVDELVPGETGCLRAGSYAEDDQIRIATPDITLTSYPGERATIVGRLWILPDGDRATVEQLDLDGRNGESLPSPTINAHRVTLAGNDVTNENTAICVSVNDFEGPVPEGVVIEENRIHDCGELPPTNRHHGIYLADSRDAIIRDNWIYDNADRGIQLYPEADGTLVTGNVIDGNGVGIVIAGDEDEASNDNIVVGNAITNSTVGYNVHENWPGPVGSGNIVRSNCVYGGARDQGEGGIETPAEGYTVEDNLVAEPGYLDPEDGNFELPEDSPCREVLDGSSTW